MPLKDDAGSRGEGEDARWTFWGAHRVRCNRVTGRVRVNFGLISPFLSQILSDYCRRSLSRGKGKGNGSLYSNVTTLSLTAPRQVPRPGEGLWHHHYLTCCHSCVPMPAPQPLSKWRHISLSPMSARVLGHRAHAACVLCFFEALIRQGFVLCITHYMGSYICVLASRTKEGV